MDDFKIDETVITESARRVLNDKHFKMPGRPQERRPKIPWWFRVIERIFWRWIKKELK